VGLSTSMGISPPYYANSLLNRVPFIRPSNVTILSILPRKKGRASKFQFLPSYIFSVAIFLTVFPRRLADRSCILTPNCGLKFIAIWGCL